MTWRLSFMSFGAWNVNLWKRAVKNRNNSILASVSPRQTLFPEITATLGASAKGLGSMTSVGLICHSRMSIALVS